MEDNSDETMDINKGEEIRQKRKNLSIILFINFFFFFLLGEGRGKGSINSQLSGIWVEICKQNRFVYHIVISRIVNEIANY